MCLVTFPDAYKRLGRILDPYGVAQQRVPIELAGHDPPAEQGRTALA